MKHLVKSNAQDAAVHSRHALGAPVLGVLADQSVKTLDLSHRAVEESARKARHVWLDLLRLEKGGDDVLRRVPSHFPLKEHLHGEFARPSS